MALVLTTIVVIQTEGIMERVNVSADMIARHFLMLNLMRSCTRIAQFVTVPLKEQLQQLEQVSFNFGSSLLTLLTTTNHPQVTFKWLLIHLRRQYRS